MRLLGLETSEYVSGIALWADGALEAEHSFPSRMNLCETLTARIQELLGVDRACEANLDGLAISQGPGSFTGLRVGMATAKALAHVCKLPLVGVPTQKVLAAAAEAPPGTVVCVLQKARQGHVYAGLWTVTPEGAQALEPLEVVAVADFPKWLDGRSSLLIGPGAEAIAEKLADLPEATRIQASMPQARLVAELGAQRLAEADPAAAYNLQPVYVLASQAERQKGLDLSAAPGTPASLPAPGASPMPAEMPADPARPRIAIRCATVADLRDIMRIEHASFSCPWSEISIREELSGREGSLFLALEMDDEVVAYSGAWLFAGEIHICTIAVDPGKRRHGLGELLMLSVLRFAGTHDIGYALLEYRISNRPAETLYKKLGFQFLHRRKRYYQDNGEDAMVVAIADLGTAARQQYLDDLYHKWLGRFPYEVSVDF